MEEKDQTIIHFPAYAELKTAIESLQANLNLLLLEHDELIYVVCKNIETKYLLAAGHLDYKIYQLDCDIRRLKRKADLIQARINRQMSVDLSAIDSQLNDEFKEYQQQMKKMLKDLNAAMRRASGKLLTTEEMLELKDLYRKIMKKLHPDLNPDIDSDKQELFLHAIEAYKNGDLDRLRMITMMVDDGVSLGPSERSLNKLQKEKQRLEEQVKLVNESIKKIQSEFPYTLKALVSDPAELDKHVVYLNETIEEMEEVLRWYVQKINDLVGENHE